MNFFLVTTVAIVANVTTVTTVTTGTTVTTVTTVTTAGHGYLGDGQCSGHGGQSEGTPSALTRFPGLVWILVLWWVWWNIVW